jgi:lysine 2,3-aminomutase
MLDIPGGHGKVPLTPGYLEGGEAQGYMIEDIHGCKHSYKDEPL